MMMLCPWPKRCKILLATVVICAATPFSNASAEPIFGEWSEGGTRVDRDGRKHRVRCRLTIHAQGGSYGLQIAAQQLLVLWEEILDRDLQTTIVGQPERVYAKFVRGIRSLPVIIAN